MKPLSGQSSIPRIKRLHVFNYRSIGEEWVEIEFPRNHPLVLIGENNAGKSNILRAQRVESDLTSERRTYKKVEFPRAWCGSCWDSLCYVFDAGDVDLGLSTCEVRGFRPTWASAQSVPPKYSRVQTRSCHKGIQSSIRSKLTIRREPCTS